jgi:KUP system potassium uptake protein
LIGFGSSTALATAYGVSVTGTMLITSVILIVAMRKRAIDAAGPVLAAGIAVRAGRCRVPVRQPGEVHGRRLVPDPAGHRRVHELLRTWGRGRQLLQAENHQGTASGSTTFLPGLMLSPPVRVQGTAIFLTAQKGIVPKALLHNLKHNKVLHERNVLLTVETKGVPFVNADSRLTMETIGNDFYRATIRYGSWKRRMCRWP